MARFEAKNISADTQSAIEGMKKEQGLTNDGVVNTLASLIPLFVAMKDKGLSLEQAIERLTADNTVTEIKIIKKGINESEFAIWKDKLFNHNANCETIDRVFISQNLFIELIGGNVQSIQKQFSLFEDEINKHNADTGLTIGANRKLSNRLRESKQADNLIEWLKAKLR